jgi:hypothetical protein
LPRTATVNTTNTSTTITAASGTFAQADVGATNTGTGFQANTTITADRRGWLDTRQIDRRPACSLTAQLHTPRVRLGADRGGGAKRGEETYE